MRAAWEKLKTTDWKSPTVICFAFVMLLSYFTYFHNYWNPPALFWDENYHIASAQKYLNGVYFMEPHPPLAKLFIAAGEWLLHPNAATDQFIGTDYGTALPANFSFAGYRFFPTLFAWLIAPLFFCIFLLLTRNSSLSLFLSILYIFDNALIVHSRSAMLDSTLHFFVMASVFLFLLLIRSKDNTKKFRTYALLFGLIFGAIVTTKANGLAMLLLVPALLWKLRSSLQRIPEFCVLMLVGFMAVYAGVWYIHFALGSTVNHSLPDNGYYQASESYKEILDEGGNRSILNFSLMLKEHLAFLPHYEKGVPKLDLCKPAENGSPWFLWPVGARTINYRWWTPGNPPVYSYLYMVPNPVGWFFGLAGVLLAVCLLLGSVFLPLQEKLQYRFELTTFLLIYLGYMAAVSRIDRVMYLYHYFIPLMMSFLLFGLAVMEIKRFLGWRITMQTKTAIVTLCGLLIFGGYQFMRPLTYYEPISDEAFEKRDLLKIWDMKCVRCEKDSVLTEKSC